MINRKENYEGLVAIDERKLERQYPELRSITHTVQTVVSRALAPYTETTSLAKLPALALVPQGNIQAFIHGATKIKGQEIYGAYQEAPFMYLPYEDVVVTPQQRVKKMLQTEQGRMQIKDGLAEEYVHALTTIDSGEGIRVGFASLPFPRDPDSFKFTPGNIYEHKLDTGAPPEDIPGQQEDLWLTENATRLIVHTLFPELFPGIGRRYPIASIQDAQHDLWIGAKSEHLLKSLFMALYTGDKSRLEVPDISGRSLLTALSRPLDTSSQILSINPHRQPGEEGAINLLLY